MVRILLEQIRLQNQASAIWVSVRNETFEVSNFTHYINVHSVQSEALFVVSTLFYERGTVTIVWDPTVKYLFFYLNLDLNGKSSQNILGTI